MKYSIRYLISFLTLLIFSCSSDDEGGGSASNTSNVTSITLSTTSQSLNSSTPVEFVVTDNLGNDVTGESSFLADGTAIETPHLFDIPGTYSVVADFNGLTSNTLEITIQASSLTSISLMLNEDSYMVGDSAYYNVRDNLDNNITNASQIKVNGSVITDNPFVFNSGGVYEFVATYQGLISDPVVIEILTASEYSDTSEFVSSGAPSNFTKKVLLEETTGTWCPSCPAGAAYMAAATESNPNVFGAAFHTGNAGTPDPMEIPETNFWVGYYNSYIFPTIYVNGPDTVWGYPDTTQIENELAEQATVGLSINAELIAGKLDIEVSVGFNATPNEELKLMIFLIEGQATYSNSPQAGSTSGAAYLHKDILREVYTDQLGDVIPANNTLAGGIYTRTITGLDIPSNTTDYDDLYIVAYVRNSYNKTFTSQAGTFPDSPHYDIYNVQEVRIGETADFD